MKRLVSIILAIILTVGTAGIIAQGEEERYITLGPVTYCITNDYAIVYSCDREFSGEVTVPKEVSGYPVLSVDDGAFYSCEKIEKVDLSVTELRGLGRSALEHCTSLKEVALPQTLEGIDEAAFANCTSLEEIDLSHLPIISIYPETFAGCRSLKKVVLPQTLVRIAPKAFAYCTSMEEIELPNSLEAIEQAPFAGCENLKEVKIHPENESFSFEGGVIYNKDKTELVCCLPYVTGSFTVPESVSKISPGAFYASGIEELTVGKNVSDLTENSVIFCQKLKKLNIFSQKIEAWAVRWCKNLRETVLEESVEEATESTFEECDIDSLTIKSDALSPDLIVYYGNVNLIAAHTGSAAEKYALESGTDFLALGGEDASILANGKKVEGNAYAVLDKGNILLPIKATAEALGAQVTPDASGGVVVERKNLKIQINPNKSEIYINGEKIMLALAPRVLNGVLYVPQNVIETAFDSEVYGSADLNSVLIYEKPDKNEPVIPPTDISGEDLTESFYIGEDDMPYVCFRDEDGNIRVKTNYLSDKIIDYIEFDDYVYFDIVLFSSLGFSDGFIDMKKGDEKGYMDIYGNELVMGVYKTIEPFYNGMAAVSSRPITAAPFRGGIKMGFINKKGEMVIPEKYVGTNRFSEGVCAVNEKYYNYYDGEGGWYFIDETGKKVFGDKTFLYAESFSHGYCAVQTKGASDEGGRKFSYIDRTGNLATDKEWDKVYPFDETGRAKVWDGDTLKIIDRSFEVVGVVEGAVREPEIYPV